MTDKQPLTATQQKELLQIAEGADKIREIYDVLLPDSMTPHQEPTVEYVEQKGHRRYYKMTQIVRVN